MNGVYNLFDRDGYHYCVYGGTKVLKSFDGNQPTGKIAIVRSVDVTAGLPPDVAKSVTRIIGLGMTYDGYLAAAIIGVKWRTGAHCYSQSEMRQHESVRT